MGILICLLQFIAWMHVLQPDLAHCWRCKSKDSAVPASAGRVVMARGAIGVYVTLPVTAVLHAFETILVS